MTDTQVKRVYGWKPDLPSHHDNFLLTAHPDKLTTFPKTKFLGNLPPVYDQGLIGSCTASALAAAFEYEQIKQGLTDFMPSRLFIYYNERKLEGTVSQDAGAMISDGIKVVTDSGVCSETTWPYITEQFATQPSDTSYTEASDHQVLASKRVPVTVNGFKTMINMGYPIAFGFTVFNYFESEKMATSGILKMPEKHEKSIGGHAVVCVGYSSTMKVGNTVGYFKIRNSWGTNWGISGGGEPGGYFWMPYSYISLCSDAWIITQNEADLVQENKKLADPSI